MLAPPYAVSVDGVQAETASIRNAYTRLISGEIDTLNAADVVTILNLHSDQLLPLADKREALIHVITKASDHMNASELSTILHGLGSLDLEPGQAQNPFSALSAEKPPT